MSATQGDRSGYMPLAGEYGFIFNFGSNTNVIGHELAHGAFNLRHTFSDKAQYHLPERTTLNLMDYANGTELWKYQWDLIHNPETILLGFMQDESEGAKDHFSLMIPILIKVTEEGNCHLLVSALNLDSDTRYLVLFAGGTINSIVTQFDINSLIESYNGAYKEWISLKPWELNTFCQKFNDDIIKSTLGPVGIIALQAVDNKDKIINDVKLFFEKVISNDPYAVGQLTGFIITLSTPASEAGGATTVANITKKSLRSASANIEKAAKLGLKSSVVDGVLTFSDDAGKALLTVEKAGDDLVCKGDIFVDLSKMVDELLDAVSQITNKTKKHILEGEVGSGYVKGEKVWTAKGVHHNSAVENGFAKIDKSTFIEGPNGIYKAKVSVKEGNKWTPKLTNDGYSTFFPKNWSENKVLNEISNAFKNKELVTGNTWRGFSRDGKIEIWMYLDKEGNIISAFPKNF